jgi:RNA polymerase sigma-B factor
MAHVPGAGSLGAPKAPAAGARAAETAALLRAYTVAPSAALEAELMRRHSPLAEQLARRFAHRGEPLEDLRQVAGLALLRALRAYDPDRGTALTTYAVPTIVGALKRHFRDRGWLVRPPRRLQETYLAVHQGMCDLEAGLGRAPTLEELASHVAVPVADVTASLMAAGARRPAGPGTGGDGADGHDDPALGDDVAMARAEDAWFVQELVRALPDTERRVVTLSFFTGLSQAQIAARLGTSQSTVCRLRQRALGRMRTLHDRRADAA